MKKVMSQQKTKHKESIRILTTALANCWHAANTYDGNYVQACDHVMIIATNALKSSKKA